MSNYPRAGSICIAASLLEAGLNGTLSVQLKSHQRNIAGVSLHISALMLKRKRPTVESNFF